MAASAPVRIGPPSALRRGDGSVVVESDGSISLTPEAGDFVVLPNNTWLAGTTLVGSSDEPIVRLDGTGLNYIQFGRFSYFDSAAGGIKSVAVPASGGTGYVVGDILTITGGTGGGATVKVTSVSSGAVTGLMIAYQGYNYGNSNFTAGYTGGSGSSIGTSTATVWSDFDARDRGAVFTVVNDVPNATAHAPGGIMAQVWASSSSVVSPMGSFAGYFEANDRLDVTTLNPPSLYGVRIAVKPLVDRSNVPVDDVACLLMANEGTGKGTDTLYIGQSDGLPVNGSSHVDWETAIQVQTRCSYGLFVGSGVAPTGLDLVNSTLTSSCRFPNNTPIKWRNVAGDGDVTALSVSTTNYVVVGGGVLVDTSGRIGVMSTVPDATKGVNIAPQVSLASVPYTGGEAAPVVTTPGANGIWGLRSNTLTFFTGTQSGTVIGTEGTVANAHTGTITTAVALNSVLQVLAAGVITSGYGLLVGGTVAAGGEFTIRTGIRIEDITGAGIVDTNYGLYISAQAKGGTTNYALYAEAGKVRFADEVRIDSTTKAFIPPRMTGTQRDAIASPIAGMVVYNSTTNKLNVYTGGGWEAVTSA